MSESKSELKRMCVMNPLEMAEKLHQLEQQLTVEREAHLGTFNKLKDATLSVQNWKIQYESAEQKLRESQKPLSDNYIQQVPDKCDRIVWRGNYYHLPIPPADVAELQRENERLREESNRLHNVAVIARQELLHETKKYDEESAALTRKLAETQARLHPSVRGILGTPELTKLLEEAKRHTVPEGWRLVPAHHKRMRLEFWDGKFWQPEGSVDFEREIASMLSAAPQLSPATEERKD